jgi:hypothetical protein
MARTTSLVATAIDALGHADGVSVGALVGELRGVLKDKDRALRSSVPRARRREVAADDVVLLDALVSQKPISRLRARPVLTSKRDALAHAVADLLQELAKPSSEASVFEGRFVDLALCPMLGRVRSLMLPSRDRLHRTMRFVLP